MTAWNIFHRKAQPPQEVKTGRFELEQGGEVAYLEYTLSGNILGLLHTEVPASLRHHGVASQLAETALNYARENKLKVDIVCPLVEEYVAKHPEYNDLLLR